MIETSAAELACLQALVRRFERPRVVEIGAWLGASALAMLAAGAAAVHCVDTWLGSEDPWDETFAVAHALGHDGLLRRFCGSIGGELGRRVFPYVGASAFWAEVWPWQADLVFIDADHRYAAALADIRGWSRHVRRDGILCGHDYSEGWPGVMRAVDETGGAETAEALWWRVI
jgi:hypothetical protein